MKKVPADEQHFGVNLDEATCSLCSESHYLGTKCVKYMALSSAERMEVARKLKLCFNCLVVGHRMSECSSTWRCLASECEKKHHTTLHENFIQTDAYQKLEDHDGDFVKGGNMLPTSSLGNELNCHG